MTIYIGGDWMEADIVVRKRSVRITGQWRSTEQILRRLPSEVAAGQENIEISANFGYLELSKYEVQAWLRPAFMFVVRNVSTAEDRVPWAYSLAEPATQTTQVSLDEGLGSWGSSDIV